MKNNIKNIHSFALCLTLRLTNEVAGYSGGHGSLTRNDIVPNGLQAKTTVWVKHKSDNLAKRNCFGRLLNLRQYSVPFLCVRAHRIYKYFTALLEKSSTKSWLACLILYLLQNPVVTFSTERHLMTHGSPSSVVSCWGRCLRTRSWK